VGMEYVWMKNGKVLETDSSRHLIMHHSVQSAGKEAQGDDLESFHAGIIERARTPFSLDGRIGRHGCDEVRRCRCLEATTLPGANFGSPSLAGDFRTILRSWL